MGARAFLFLCFSVLTAIIISALLRFLFPCVSQRRSGWKRATQLITNTMPRTLGPTGAPTKSWMYNFFYTLMAMTLAYLVMTLTVSKCCYRSVRRPVRILTPLFRLPAGVHPLGARALRRSLSLLGRAVRSPGFHSLLIAVTTTTTSRCSAVPLALTATRACTLA